MTQPTPREVMVNQLCLRFRRNIAQLEYVSARLFNDAYSVIRRSATDPVTGTTIYSTWWDTRIDNGDSEAELAARIRKWAETQILD